MVNIWRVIGVLLVAWVAWDLYAGYTLGWSKVERADNPILYWSLIAIWSSLAASCFYSWGEDDE